MLFYTVFYILSIDSSTSNTALVLTMFLLWTSVTSNKGLIVRYTFSKHYHILYTLYIVDIWPKKNEYIIIVTQKGFCFMLTYKITYFTTMKTFYSKTQYLVWNESHSKRWSLRRGVTNLAKKEKWESIFGICIFVDQI